MYSEALKQLIDAALTDGVITEQERQVIKKKAIAENVDPDEIDVYLNSEIQRINMQKQQSTGIIKCPACGEIVPPLTGVCPSCGHIISFHSEDTQKTSLLNLKKQLDALFVQYSKKSITFVDYILLFVPIVIIPYMLFLLWKIRKAKNIYAEFNNIRSNAVLLYGNDSTAKSYLAEIGDKMDSAYKKGKVKVVIAYILVFLGIFSIPSQIELLYILYIYFIG